MLVWELRKTFIKKKEEKKKKERRRLVCVRAKQLVRRIFARKGKRNGAIRIYTMTSLEKKLAAMTIKLTCEVPRVVCVEVVMHELSTFY